MTLKHLRSSTADKRPQASGMAEGQLAINTASGSPGLFFKDSAGNLAKVGPVHVGSGAPNASPASGGTSGNSLGEQWLDTSGGTYVFKIWDGAAWRSEAGEFVNTTGDTMTGALGVIAGSASTPGLFFSGDANSGIYSPGADQVAISTSGSGRLFVDASGNVGFNKTPSNSANYTTLDISGANGGQFLLGRAGFLDAFIYSSNGLAALGAGSGSALAFFTNSSGSGNERLRITSAGLVGVGTSNPATALDVNGTITARGSLIFKDANNSNTYGLRALSGIIVADTGTNYPTGWNFQYGNTASSALYIDSSGRVGVGTTSPAAPLDVNGAIYSRSSGVYADAITAYSGSSLAINAGSSNLNITVNASERLRIDSSGRVGIGTSSPVATNHIRGSGTSGQVTASWILENASSGAVGMDVTGAAGSSIWRFLYTGSGPQTGTNTFNTALSIGVEGSAAGRVGIGTTSPNSNGLVTIYEGSGAKLFLSDGQLGLTYGARLTGGGIGGDGSYAELGVVDNNTYNKAITVTSQANNIVFGKGATEKARIDSSGRLLVGTSSSPTGGQGVNSRLVVQGYVGDANDIGIISIQRGETAGNITSGEYIGRIAFNDSTGNSFAYVEALADANAGSGDFPGRLSFSTTADGASSPTERMRIDSSGRLLVGTTSALGPSTTSTGITFFPGDYSVMSSAGNEPLTLNRNNDGVILSCRRSGTNVGSISVTTTATAFNTSSDYRLKENVVDLDGAVDRLKQLPVCRFNFIADPDKTVDGFIAHEVQAVVPEAVTGAKDEVDADGNPIYQGIDQSKLVPLLTAALQEAIGRIEALEAEVAALKAQ